MDASGKKYIFSGDVQKKRKQNNNTDENKSSAARGGGGIGRTAGRMIRLYEAVNT